VIDEALVAMGLDGAMCTGADLFQIVRPAAKDILAQAEALVKRASIDVDASLPDSVEGRVCDLVVKAAGSISACRGACLAAYAHRPART
jgi:hypothetical protein